MPWVITLKCWKQNQQSVSGRNIKLKLVRQITQDGLQHLRKLNLQQNVNSFAISLLYSYTDCLIFM